LVEAVRRLGAEIAEGGQADEDAASESAADAPADESIEA